jgi:hypothetical protein
MTSMAKKWPKFLTNTYPLSGIKKKTRKWQKGQSNPEKRPTFNVGIEHP